MNPNSLYNIPFLDLSDSSLNGRFHSCARKFELNKLFGHSRAEAEGSIYAEVGKALHEGWQTYMTTGKRDDGAWALIKRYPKPQSGIDIPTPMQSLSVEAVYATYLEMASHPIDSRYQLATVNVNGVNRPAVEVPFRIVFKDVSLLRSRRIPIRYIGFIDAILFDTVTGTYVVVDVKTTSKRRNDYSVMFGRDPQCLPYAYVLEAIQGLPISNLDVMYFVAYVDTMEPKVFKYDFIKNANDIQEWGFNISKDIRDIQMYAEMQYFPRNGKSCDTYRVCQYNNICDYREPEAIERLLQMTYGAVDWQKQAEDFKPWFEVELTIPGL